MFVSTVGFLNKCVYEREFQSIFLPEYQYQSPQRGTNSFFKNSNGFWASEIRVKDIVVKIGFKDRAHVMFMLIMKLQYLNH